MISMSPGTVKGRVTAAKAKGMAIKERLRRNLNPTPDKMAAVQRKTYRKT